MKLFVPDSPAWTAPTETLSPVLQVHWDGVAIQDRRHGGAHPRSPFTLVDTGHAADVHVLPQEWSHYLRTSTVDWACALGARAAGVGKPVLIWHSGDLPPVIPIANAVTFQPGLYRSRMRPNQHAAPSFEGDPLAGVPFVPRPKRAVPIVGFCGYAALVPAKILYSVYAAAVHNVKHLVGRALYEGMPLVPATVLRATVLRALAASRRIDTDFVVNSRAFKRRDARTDADTRAAQMAAFRRNVIGTDYTVCIRGYGNWSRRFYETLACGRIPVFIDTDCVLPGEGQIDWREYCVWIEPRDRSRVADRILEFHERHDDGAFAARQHACRQLWQEWLTPGGFMQHLPETLGYRQRVTDGRSAPAVPPHLPELEVPCV